MNDSLYSHLLQWQRRRFGYRAALVHLAAHSALLLLIFGDGGVVHHGKVGVLAVSQTREDVLRRETREDSPVQPSVSSPTDISQGSDSAG